MNPIWLEVIAVDNTLERFSYIVTSFYLTNDKGWAVVVGNYGDVETYHFGEDEAKARSMYEALCGFRETGGLITFHEKDRRECRGAR